MTNFSSVRRIAILWLCFAFASAHADSILNFVAVGNGADAIATNPITNVTYVADSGDGTVSIFSGMDDKVTSLTTGSGPIAIAINALTNKIYVANEGGGTVAVIDGATETVTTHVTVGENPMAIAINPATNTIYVANFGDGHTMSTVSVIDGASNQVTSIPVGVSPMAVAVDEVANLIYVVNFGDGTSPGTVSYISGSLGIVLDTIPVGTGCAAIAVNPLTTRAYVTNTVDGTVSVIDGETALASTVTVGSGPVAVAVNPITNLIYVANNGSSSLSIIDGNTQAVGTIPVEANPSAVAIDSATNKVYVPTNPSGAGSLDILDANTGAVTTLAGVGTMGTVATPIVGTPIAVDPLTNHIYLAASNINSVTVIDGSAPQASTVLAGNDLRLIAVNPVTNLAYAVDLDDNAVPSLPTVTVLNDSGPVATIPTGQFPFAIAINPAANLIYVINGDSTLTEINGATNEANTIALPGTPQAVAVNPATNTVYVAIIPPTGQSYLVDVLNRTTGSISTVNLGTDSTSSLPHYIAVNSATNQIYLTAGLDSLIVIDGESLATTTVQVGNGPEKLAIDTATNQIFVVNEGDGAVTQIDGATNTATQTISVGANPFTIVVDPVTQGVYTVVHPGSGDGVTVFTEGSTATATLNIPSSEVIFDMAINPATNTLYVSGLTSAIGSGVLNAIDLVSGVATNTAFPGGQSYLAVNPTNGDAFVAVPNTVSLIQSSPGNQGNLATFIQPLSNNVAHTAAPVLSVTATDLAGPLHPAIEQIFYQVDSTEGPWLFAAPAAASPASALASLNGLSVGVHTLFAFAADGQESPNDNTGLGNSPIVGAIASYSFVVTPGNFSFTAPVTMAHNTDASVTVTVQRDFTDPTSVAYQTVDGTAVAGTDYVATQGTLSFAQDEISKIITVPLLPGAAVQTSVGFSVQLSNPATLATVGPSTQVLVLNNDSADVQLSQVASTAPTAPGLATGSITVNLTPNTDGEQWRLFGALSWQNSGATVTGLTAGSYEVEFKPIAGFQAPSIQGVPVTTGSSVVVAGTYTATGSQPQGSLLVTLAPAGTGGWRFQGETQYRPSGVTVSNLNAGSYILEFEPVTGLSTPADEEVIIQSLTLDAITVTYYLADATTGATPILVPSSQAQIMAPYEFLGQIQTDNGLGSGFVPLDRVVVTAAHVIFDDGSLSFVQGVRWFFQYEIGVYESPVQIPRGAYVFDGYAAQRAADESAPGGMPGVSSTQSQQLDAAALFFLEPAARGGQSGYLASNSSSNTWLTGGRDKLIAGYPADGVPANAIGLLYATPIVTSALDFDTTGLFRTTALTSYEGNSGGPLCVRFDDGTLYPAAIYLGGTDETVVRAIDSQVIDLMNSAEMAGNGGANPLPEGTTEVNLGISGTTAFAYGSVSVTLGPPGAVGAGAQWELTSDTMARNSGSSALGLAPGSYTVTFTDVAGYTTPAPQTAMVTAGNVTALTAAYIPNVVPTITSSGSVSIGSGQYFQDQIIATFDPTSYTASGLPAGLLLNPTTGLIYGTPTKAGMSVVTLTATNAHGASNQFDLTITVIPPGQLTIAIVGKGSVPAKFAHTTIQHVGSALAITATPAAGYLFDSWSLPGTNGAIGAILSTQPTYRFTMPEHLSLQVNFVTNPFLTSKGSYLGLLQGGIYDNSGFLQCTVGSLGSFTATLTLGGYTAKVVNAFNDQEQYRGQIVLHDGRLFNVTLQLTANAVLSGTLTNLNDASQLTLSATRAAPPPKAQVGAYTVVLPLATSDSSLPAGNGYGTLSITATGAANFTGVLGDGTSFHAVGSVDSHGAYPFYFFKAAGKTTGAELVLGTLSANVSPAPAGYTASLDWFRQPDALYPDGFATQISLQAGRYKAPAVKNIDASVVFSGGDLTGSVTKAITIDATGKVHYAGADPFKLTFNAATGLFTGSFEDTGNIPRTFNGALLQSSDQGLGLFLEPGGTTGAVSLQKTP